MLHQLFFSMIMLSNSVASVDGNASFSATQALENLAVSHRSVVVQELQSEYAASKKKKKAKKKKPRCRDGKDNDGDGLVDYPADPGCKSKKDNSEKNPSNPGAPADPNYGNGASLQGRKIFPDDNAWNTDISNAAVDPNSNAILSSIGLNTGLHPDFGTMWQGAPIGIPYTVVRGNQPGVNVTFDYDDESDHGLYPIPSDAPIEGGSNADGDRHILVVDWDNWLLYELFYAFPTASGWHAGSGAVFDLNSNALRPPGWTSADAAGLPILPGLVRYDEVYEQGEINHALRFTVSRSRRAYVHPARHFASSRTDPNLPPMGMRVRLKANYDISSFPVPVQVILRALKKYGMFVADNGSNWYISGAHDMRWDDDELSEIRRVKGSDFEVIEMGEVITD